MNSSKPKQTVTKAFILAAGLGTRLLPYTENLPKALVHYKGRPMIENVISRISGAGIDNIFINAHHHFDKMESYFKNWKGKENITLIHEKEILGTGGALKNAENYFDDDENIIIYNTDVETNADLAGMINYHYTKKSDVTLAVKDRKTSRYLLMDSSSRIAGRTENNVNKIYMVSEKSFEIKKIAFCGIHILNTRILNFFPPLANYDIIPVYMKLISENTAIYGYSLNNYLWKDLGIPENL